jgi:hypothetical protein
VRFKAELRLTGGGTANFECAFKTALQCASVHEAIAKLKAEAPREWLLDGEKIEANLKRHFAAASSHSSNIIL